MPLDVEPRVVPGWGAPRDLSGMIAGAERPFAGGRILLSKVCDISFATPEKESFWFGYYNYSPISLDGRRMLAHRVDFEGRMPRADDRCEVGCFDLCDGSWHRLGESTAFNWQQGSMLQWLGPDFDTRVIFNDAKASHFVARVVSVATGESRTVPEAVYAVAASGRFTVTLNFERAFWTRAYSYSTIANDAWNTRIPEGDGLFRVDLETGERTRIVALENVVHECGEGDDGVSTHWLEHLILNPSGTRVAFYHRFGTSTNYTTRLLTADCDGGKVWCHPLEPEERLSHLGWRSDTEYAVFSLRPSRVGVAYASLVKSRGIGARALVQLYRRLVKPFAPPRQGAATASASGYSLTEDGSGIRARQTAGLLSQDGHPSFSRDGRYMLTDTYADEAGFRHLVLFDFVRTRLIPLARFFSRFNDCGWRADLHPRFSRDESKVVVDSAHNGYHQMVVLDLDWEAVAEER